MFISLLVINTICLPLYAKTMFYIIHFTSTIIIPNFSDCNNYTFNENNKLKRHIFSSRRSQDSN